MTELSFDSSRRYGVEFEYLAFDGKLRPDQGQKPAGIDYIGMIVALNSDEGVDVKDWEHTNDNHGWVVKPDSSCGMEVCTPIYKGALGVKKCCEVINAFRTDPKIKIDHKCSVHIHVEVADMTVDEIGSVIAHWFKVEPVFMDSVPNSRKRNKYCQFMGMMELLEHDTLITPNDLIKKVGSVKYYSLNTHQYMKGARKTIEFRIAEGDGCKDPYFVKNWVRLIVHFVEMAKKKPYPIAYDEKRTDDPWQSFLWLDVEDTLKLLGMSGEYKLSPGLTETRNWFLARLLKYMCKDESGPRAFAYNDLKKVVNKLSAEGMRITPELLTPSDMNTALFSEYLAT